MKTVKEIANDCGISEIGSDRITEILQDPSPTFDGRLIGALYRRIEKLEEGSKMEIDRLKQELAEEKEFIGSIQIRTIMQEKDEMARRIEKLETEKAAAVDMLRSVSLDCQMALNADDRIIPGDFRCMREGADNVLAQMGAEPPVHVSEEAP